MFAHVRSCSACSACSQLVQGMFARPEHAKHAIDCKMANIFLISAFHVKACSACSEPKLNGKEKLVMKIKQVSYLGICQHVF